MRLRKNTNIHTHALVLFVLIGEFFAIFMNERTNKRYSSERFLFKNVVLLINKSRILIQKHFRRICCWFSHQFIYMIYVFSFNAQCALLSFFLYLFTLNLHEIRWIYFKKKFNQNFWLLLHFFSHDFCLFLYYEAFFVLNLIEFLFGILD